MTAQTFEGFLLTRNWRDTPAGVELEFWFSTHEGPLCATVRKERAVFFLPLEAREQAAQLLRQEPGLEIKEVNLRTFAMAPAIALYFPQYRRARRAADALREHGLDPLEADINPADRFLMERFIAGSAQLHGEPQRRGKFLRLENPNFKAAQYRPALKVVSYDIETAMSGLQLYSIAVHGKSAAGEERVVFMLGEGASQDYVVTCDTQESLLQAFVDWVTQYDPDVLIGWNVINFDTRYLQRVADHLGRRLLLGRDKRPGHWRELGDYVDRFAVQFPGRVILDGIEMLRAAFYRFEVSHCRMLPPRCWGRGSCCTVVTEGRKLRGSFRKTKRPWPNTTSKTASWCLIYLRQLRCWISLWLAVL